MALNVLLFTQTLDDLFNSMTRGTPEELPMKFANGLVSAYETFLATGITSTTDSGTGISPTGSYAGSSSKLDALTLKPGMALDYYERTANDFKVVKIGDTYVFNDKDHSPLSSGSEMYAKLLAQIIDEYTTGGVINTQTSGLITVPADPPYTVPASASATGKFISPGYSSVQSSLLDTFDYMTRHPSLATSYMFAQSLATAINSYLLSGSVSISFESATIVGTGAGKLT